MSPSVDDSADRDLVDYLSKLSVDWPRGMASQQQFANDAFGCYRQMHDSSGRVARPKPMLTLRKEVEPHRRLQAISKGLPCGIPRLRSKRI